MPQLIVLGTAAAETTADRDHAGYVLDLGSTLLGIDAGTNVFARLLRCGRDPLRMGHLLITHRHLDHLGGLAILIDQMRLHQRREPLTLWGLAETLDAARAHLKVFDMALEGPGMAVLPRTIELDSTIELEGGIGIKTTGAVHSVPAVSVRVDLPAGRSFCFSGDTAPHQGLEQLYRDCTLLLHECTFNDAHIVKAHQHGHCTPADVRRIAASCGAGSVLLTHLGPSMLADPERVLARDRADFDCPLAFAEDFMIIDL